MEGFQIQPQSEYLCGPCYLVQTSSQLLTCLSGITCRANEIPVPLDVQPLGTACSLGPRLCMAQMLTYRACVPGPANAISKAIWGVPSLLFFVALLGRSRPPPPSPDRHIYSLRPVYRAKGALLGLGCCSSPSIVIVSMLPSSTTEK